MKTHISFNLKDKTYQLDINFQTDFELLENCIYIYGDMITRDFIQYCGLFLVIL